MITTVKNWSLVTIEDEQFESFKILWAIIVKCERYKKDSYICTSRIISIEGDLVTTKSGSTYKLLGKGVEHTTSYAGLLLLGKGISPKELFKEYK